jgi:hypothetical protein
MSIPPFRLRFENNDSFEHRERRWIGRGIGASRFAQDMIDFRKIHQDLIRKFRTPDVLPKSFHYDGVFGVRCEPKTVRFLRRQGKAHDSYSTKSEQKLTGVFYC